jgi:thymidylate synthase
MNQQNVFSDADGAFQYYYNMISDTGMDFDNTKAMFNQGFTIFNPLQNLIKAPFRKWSETYAQREWKWYMSEDRDATKIAKYAPIWNKMHSGDGIVNSNYGWQWNRGSQLARIVEMLRTQPNTRRAWLTIYDGKEMLDYEYDTPCTIGLGFFIVDNKLNMSVIMRSNYLWYGFCNDQYCFSMLQKQIASDLSINVGMYYHWAQNLHIYNDKLGLL